MGGAVTRDIDKVKYGFDNKCMEVSFAAGGGLIPTSWLVSRSQTKRILGKSSALLFWTGRMENVEEAFPGAPIPSLCALRGECQRVTL